MGVRRERCEVRRERCGSEEPLLTCCLKCPLVNCLFILEPTDNSIQMKKDLDNFMYQLRLDAVVSVVELVSLCCLQWSNTFICDVC